MNIITAAPNSSTTYQTRTSTLLIPPTLMSSTKLSTRLSRYSASWESTGTMWWFTIQNHTSFGTKSRQATSLSFSSLQAQLRSSLLLWTKKLSFSIFQSLKVSSWGKLRQSTAAKLYPLLSVKTGATYLLEAKTTYSKFGTTRHRKPYHIGSKATSATPNQSSMHSSIRWTVDKFSVLLI